MSVTLYSNASFPKYSLSPDEIMALNAPDRSSSFEEYRRISNKLRFEAKNQREAFANFVARHGVKMFKPHGYSEAQAFANRYEVLGTLDAILVDYDGCRSIDSLRGLIAESREHMIDVLLCTPDTAYAGKGCVEDQSVLSEYEKKNMFPIYHSFHGNGDWNQIVIDYDIYKPDCDDAHGNIHNLNIDYFFQNEKAKRYAQYEAFIDEASFDPAYELYEVCAPERLISRNNQLSEFSSEQYLRLNQCAVECAVKVLQDCDAFLYKDYSTPEDVMKDIDQIRSDFVHIFRLRRQMGEQ